MALAFKEFTAQLCQRGYKEALSTPCRVGMLDGGTLIPFLWNGEDLVEDRAQDPNLTGGI